MKLKAALAVALLTVATTASAQSTPTKPYPPGFLENLAQQMISQRQSMRAGNLNGGVLKIGLNVVHATYCVALQVGVHVVGCIFSQEGLFVCSLNPSRPASATKPLKAATTVLNLAAKLHANDIPEKKLPRTKTARLPSSSAHICDVGADTVWSTVRIRIRFGWREPIASRVA